MDGNVSAAFTLAEGVPACALLHVALFAVGVLGLRVFFCPFRSGGEDPVYVVGFAVLGVVFGDGADNEEAPVSLGE